MVWTGLHGLIGTGIALATRGRAILGDVGTRTMRFGIVWGSIIPDIDLLISIVIVAAGGSMQQALAPHRTLTQISHYTGSRFDWTLALENRLEQERWRRPLRNRGRNVRPRLV
jgi:hypothetical protein